MEIYFNWLGEWKKIDNDEDIICYLKPKEFIDNLIIYFDKQIVNKNNFEHFEFVEIVKKDENTLYKVHISQLMWKITE